MTYKIKAQEQLVQIGSNATKSNAAKNETSLPIRESNPKSFGTISCQSSMLPLDGPVHGKLANLCCYASLLLAAISSQSLYH